MKKIRLQTSEGKPVRDFDYPQLETFPVVVNWKGAAYARLGIQESTAIYREATVWNPPENSQGSPKSSTAPKTSTSP